MDETRSYLTNRERRESRLASMALAINAQSVACVTAHHPTDITACANHIIKLAEHMKGLALAWQAAQDDRCGSVRGADQSKSK